MTILVTGNLGYIGSVLTAILHEKNIDFIGYDVGYFENCLLQNSLNTFPQIKKDIRDLDNNDLKNTKLSSNDILAYFYYDSGYGGIGYGQQYGLDPQFSNVNGYFNINDRTNSISFSNDLVDKLIKFEYISDGLATDEETKVPKLAEEALYAHISHAILASRINQNEYIIQRLKRERSAKLRNAKIRLSNLKLNELVQVMRGKSKWIKH